MIQTFCVPVLGSEDPDATTHKLRKSTHEPAPLQGWEQWTADMTADIRNMIGGCESQEALTRVQNINRTLLLSLSLERSDLYKTIGDAVHGRSGELASGNSSVRPKTSAKKPSPRRPLDQAGDPIREGAPA